MNSNPNSPLGPDLFVLADQCSRSAVNRETLDQLLSRLDGDLDTFFPPPAHGELRNDPDLRRRLLRAMVRALWKQMPQPAHHYAPPKLAEPGRNDRCHCGSGKKHKVCCQPLERNLPVFNLNLLPSLLAVLPRKSWKELAGSRIDPAMVEDTVRQWLDDGQPESAAALLEPWFVEESAFVARHEYLFDALLDAYSDLGNPRKKAKLLDRAQEHGDRTLRSAAMQRKVSILADRGKFDEAWQLFRKAQKLDPDSHTLSHLEVTTLMVEGREDEARTRADFWARRLARRRQPELESLVDFLRDVARHGAGVLGEAFATQTGAGDLLAAVGKAPPLVSMYALDPVDGDAGPLTPKPRLKRALRAWREEIEPVDFFPGADRSRANPSEELNHMLALLDNFPELWSSFEVLGELVYTAREMDAPGIEDTVIVPLLDRAASLLDLVLSDNKAQACRLEWGHLDNRPALDLLGWRIGLELDRPATPEHIERLERLLQLNPHDNQGMRTPLSRRYLEADRFEAVLTLSAKYPNDFPEMQYNHALALFALGRTDEAGQALQEVAAQYPKILDALLKTRVRRPDIDPRGVRLGGDDQAWIYREEHRPIWQRLGALKWARGLKP